MPTINPSTFGSLIFRFNNQWVRDISDNKRLLKNYKIKSDSNRQYSELRLEHLMRRASQLANMRQNLFLICIWAQHLGKPTGGKTDWDTYPVKSEAQAVALIWRDPYPVSNQNQYHPKFVRFMRWME